MNTPARSRLICRRRLLRACAVFAVTSAVAATTAAHDEHTAADRTADSARARWIAGRLLAPCCWTQTLDIHDSEIATSLRVEIGQKLARGVPSAAIEADLAQRYGERIRAVPAGADPRVHIVIAVAFAMIASATVLLRRARRATQRAAMRVDQVGVVDTARDVYDALLDAELKRVEKYT